MATATTHKELTRDQALEVSRKRRDLEMKVADLTADFESQQDTVAELGQTLSDPKAHVETRVSRERKRLLALRDQLSSAERELAEYNETNPSKEQLQERERLRVEAEQAAAIKQRTKAWKANKLEVCGLLDRIAELDEEAKALGSPHGLWKQWDGQENTIQRAYRITNDGKEFSRARVASMRASIENL